MVVRTTKWSTVAVPIAAILVLMEAELLVWPPAPIVFVDNDAGVPRIIACHVVSRDARPEHTIAADALIAEATGKPAHRGWR